MLFDATKNLGLAICQYQPGNVNVHFIFIPCNP